MDTQSPWELVVAASIPVQGIMLILLLCSLACWYLIFHKWRVFRAVLRDTDAFEEQFWGGANIYQLYQTALDKGEQLGSLEHVFAAGIEEYIKWRGGSQAIELMRDKGHALDAARRAMRSAIQREIDYLDSHLDTLASIGSVSPYIGLLGTVWGIIHSFQGLAQVGQASLAQVAPGIAEALLATALGLFVAIPAVLAYNRYADRSVKIFSRFEIFMEEFSNILHRQGETT